MLHLHSVTASPANESKIAFNPHLEPHGHNSLEWSYHFSLLGADAIEAKLNIVVPGEKAPTLARESVLNRIIAHTRFSLADASSFARDLSKTFHDDSLWIKTQLSRGGSDFCGLADLENSPILLRCVRDDFTMGFLSRLTLILQSHLKRSSRSFQDAVRAANEKSASDALTVLEESLLAAKHTVNACLIWRYLREVARAHPDFSQASSNSSLEKLCRELEEIAELLLILMGRCVAEAQEVLSRDLARQKGGGELLSRWTSEIIFMRSQLGLVPLDGLNSDPEAAAKFFERTLELKRDHYRKWDLTVALNPAEARIDFWIGAAAAGISALFAFFATIAITIFFPGAGSLSAAQTSLLAISFFAGANAIIYVVKDRMKELLKIYVRRYLRLKGGKWKGICSFLPPDFEKSKDGKTAFSEIMKLDRNMRWVNEKRDWHLNLTECFQPAPLPKEIPTTTVKQLWRIPLDDILYNFDDTHHFLKIPSVDGKPHCLKTMKRVVLPFEISVRTLRESGNTIKKKIVNTVDEQIVRGNIIVYGAQIVQVQVSSNH